MSALTRQKIKLPMDQIDTLVLYHESARSIALKLSESMRQDGMRIMNGLLEQSIDDNISFAASRKIRGIMYFVSEEEVMLVNIETLERTVIKVDALIKGGV